MAKLRDLVLLLPEHELEGYPRHLPTPDAENLLASWLGLWHPLLISASQAIPRWHNAEQLPVELGQTLFVLPIVSADRVSTHHRDAITEAGGLLVEPRQSWGDLQQTLLQMIDAPPAGELAESLREDFAALGYAYLQIQLMTRQLRYTSNLDQLLFSEQACKAVDATLAGDRDTAERLLQSCFDSLGQERDHYYSLDVNLLDLTLVAKSTLGKSLSRQLDAGESTTFLASGDVLKHLSAKQPGSLARLAELQSEHKICLVGGLEFERPHPLMPRESAARDLLRGRQSYMELGLQPPRVFGRLSFGMSAETSTMLKRSGYTGALLVALTDGTYPASSQVKLSWESSDGVFLPALAAPVVDASDPASFLSLGWTIGEALDHQHVPTLILAHWPGAECGYFSLLRIIARRTPALGKWRLIDEYFVETDQPYHQERLDPNGFRFDWLSASNAPTDLIARTKHVYHLQARARSLQNLMNLRYQLDFYRHTPADAAASAEETATAPNYVALPLETWATELAHLQDLSDSLFDEATDVEAVVHAAHELSDRLSREVLEGLHRKIGKLPTATTDGMTHESRLVMNPRSTPARSQVHTNPETWLDPSAEWRFASGRVGKDQVTSVDVPSMGFIQAPVVKITSTERVKSLPLAEAGGLLRNEFLEAQLDDGRGHLRSLHVPARRGNRLSLMVALRERNNKGEFSYSEMIASDVRMLTSSNMCGLQRASGKLEKDGSKVGKFEIDYEIWRGSRVLEVTIKLSELKQLADPDPWNSAYTLRIAWPSEAALLRTFNVGSRVPWSTGRALSPELIEIDETDYHTHYLTGGLTFHRRIEMRFLETILAAGDQSSVTHRIGLGVDLPAPILAARSFMDRRYELAINSAVPTSSGWLASVDVREVVVDFEAPLVDENGKMVGIRLFVSETSGKSTNAKIRLLRAVAAASRVDYLGGVISKLTADGDRVTIALRANEQVNVDVLWKL